MTREKENIRLSDQILITLSNHSLDTALLLDSTRSLALFYQTVRICWLRTLSARPVALTTLILRIPILISVVLCLFLLGCLCLAVL